VQFVVRNGIRGRVKSMEVWLDTEGIGIALPIYVLAPKRLLILG